MQPQKKPTRKEKAKQQPARQQGNPKQLHGEEKNIHQLKLWLGLIIAAFGFILYVNTLGHKFALDDYSLIIENRSTKQGISAIGEIFKTPYRYGYVLIDDEVYRPLSKAMFAIEWSISPNNPLIGHLVNVLVYALTGFLLFITLCKYFNNKMLVPFIVSLLFMAHPIHTEVVANIKSRDELMGFLLVVLSMNFLHSYNKSGKPGSLVGMLLCFFSALLSKESFITYVATVPLMMFFFLNAGTSKILKATLFMLIPAVLFLSVRNGVLGKSLPASQNIADNLLMAAPDGAGRFATAVSIMGLYLKLLFVPHPLVFDYSYKQIPIIGLSDWRFIVSFAVYLALFIYAVINIKKKDLVAFGILYYFITLSIFTNLVLIIGTSMAERLMYGPALGICFVLAGILQRILCFTAETSSGANISQFFSLNKKVIAVATMVAVLFSVKTFSRTPVWKDNITLYSHDVSLSPNSTRAHYYLGNLLTKEEFWGGKDDNWKNMILDSALRELQKAVDIYPSFHDAYQSMGITYYRKRNFDKAMENYQLALKYNPTTAPVHNNIGTIYFETKQYDKAVLAFQNAVKYDPRYAEAYANLGSTYGEMKDYDNAIRYLGEAVKYDPNYAQALYFLGMTYGFKGDQASAQNFIRKAAALDPAYQKFVK